MAEGLYGLNAGERTEDDPRVAKILAALAGFSADNWAIELVDTGAGDAVDRIIGGLHQFAHEMRGRRAAADQQFEAILEVIMSMLALDFTKTAPIIDDGSTLDAMAFGLNNISHELALSMVSRSYVDNIIESMLDPLIVLHANATIERANRAATQLFGYTRDEWSGLPLATLLGDKAIVKRVVQVAEKRQPLSNIETIGMVRDGRTVPVALSASPMVDDGDTQVVCVVRDITERKQAEETMRQNVLQAEVIRAQAAAIAELSTPLIPISDRVLVMPLIGSVDSRRAQQVIETLLYGVSAHRVEAIIIDITGVAVVDTQVANAFVRAAQAVKLLGAQLILTGIRPEVAQTLTGLGLDLQNLITRSTLQSGIVFAMTQHGPGANHRQVV
jgi:rsbT co-antagonist protein RsbR